MNAKLTYAEITLQCDKCPEQLDLRLSEPEILDAIGPELDLTDAVVFEAAHNDWYYGISKLNNRTSQTCLCAACNLQAARYESQEREGRIERELS